MGNRGHRLPAVGDDVDVVAEPHDESTQEVLVERVVIGDQHLQRTGRNPFDDRGHDRSHRSSADLDHHVMQLARSHRLGQRCLHQSAVSGAGLLSSGRGSCDQHDRQLVGTAKRSN